MNQGLAAPSENPQFPAPAAPLLEVRDLAKYFPVRRAGLTGAPRRVHAVDGVSLAIEPGEVLGLVGESGCGKSTTGRLILRLLDPSAGSIRFLGEDLLAISPQRLKAVRRHMQMIFQDPYSSLNPRMRIGAIVEEPLIIHRIGAARERSERVEAVMAQVGLAPDILNRYPHEFSGGQRQRVGIARALILSPKLIVADEPVSSLDVSIQAQIINLLEDLQREYHLSIVCIAHDLLMIRHISDRVAVMYLGRIVELATTEALFAQPRHPYTRALLAAIPIPDPLTPPLPRLIEGDPPSPIDIPPGCRFYARCPQRIDECLRIDPQLIEVSPGQWAACILAGDPIHSSSYERTL